MNRLKSFPVLWSSTITQISLLVERGLAALAARRRG